MEAREFDKYAKAISAIECHESLMGCNVSIFPHMSKQDRTRYIKDLKGTLKKSIYREADHKPATFGQIQKVLSGVWSRGRR